MKITHLSLLLSAPLLSMRFLLILSGLSGLSLMMTSCVDQPSALPPLDQDIERQSDEDMDDSTPAPRDQVVSDMNLNISDLTPLDLWIEDQELALQDLSIDMRDPLPPELISPDPIDLSIFPPRGSVIEFWLSQTGLYDDIAQKTIARGVLPYRSRYPLWSDGSDKERWIRLPGETEIDTADMDHWQFPVGTLFYKEFSRDGVRLETRVIARMGEGARDYWMGAFIWNEDESDALFYEEGRLDVHQTSHDVPAVKACGTCHNGAPGRALGFSALQLSGSPVNAESLTLDQLDQMSRLTSSPTRSYTPPGSEEIQEALGYLHSNCGNCHNERGAAWPDTDIDLTLSVSDLTPEETAIYRTSLDVSLQYFNAQEGILRVTPGVPELSALYLRMEQRGLETQMPPLGTEITHSEGLDLIYRWIEILE